MFYICELQFFQLKSDEKKKKKETAQNRKQVIIDT